ncbi:MAG TPA: hypothetical protein VFA57_04515 [Pseudolabrys sp.]|nr:hypothetical protein [Pseudolabrys sp.]
MTASTLTFAGDRRERAVFVPTAFLTEFLAGAREGLEIQSRYHALASKSAAELARRGLTRGDIAQAALKGDQC